MQAKCGTAFLATTREVLLNIPSLKLKNVTHFCYHNVAHYILLSVGPFDLLVKQNFTFERIHYFLDGCTQFYKKRMDSCQSDAFIPLSHPCSIVHLFIVELSDILHN